MNRTQFMNTLAFICENIKGGFVTKITQPSDLELCISQTKNGDKFNLLFSCHSLLSGLYIDPPKRPSLAKPTKFCTGLRKYLLRKNLIAILVPKKSNSLSTEFKFSCNLSLRFSFDPHLMDLCLIDSNHQILHSLMRPYQEQTQLDPFKGVDFDFKTISEHSKREVLNLGLNYLSNKESRLFKKEKSDLEVSLQKSLKHLEKIKKKVTQERKKFMGALQLEKEADFLKANLYRFKDYRLQSDKPMELKLMDYKSNQEVLIAIPKNETPNSWMKTLYKKSKKYKKGMNETDKRLHWIQQQTQGIQKSLKDIKKITQKSELQKIIKNLPEDAIKTFNKKPPKRDSLKAKSPAGQKPKNIKEFKSLEGKVVLVGTSQDGNDYLTLKMANPWDVWLHVQGAPGSHVVLKCEKNKPPSLDSLIDASILALHFSSLKKSQKGEVNYTFKKNVKKPKGFPSGKVLITKEKTLMIDLKSTHSKRLKELMKK